MFELARTLDPHVTHQLLAVHEARNLKGGEGSEGSAGGSRLEVLSSSGEKTGTFLM